MVRAMVTQYRGDWKFHRVSGQHLMVTASICLLTSKQTCWISLGLRNGSTYKHGGRQSIFVMTKSDFLVVPNPLMERPRRDLQSFLNDALRPGEQSSLDCK